MTDKAEDTKDKKDKPKRPRGTGSVYRNNNSPNWWIAYYRNGVLVRESSGTPKIKTAENILQQRLGEIGAGTWIAPADKRVLVDDLYKSLLNYYSQKKRASLDGTRQRWTRNAKENEKPEPGRLQKFFGGIRAVNVTTDMLDRYVAKCEEEKLSPATINRDMAALSKAFNLAAVSKPPKIRKSEIPKFPRLEEPKARDGFLEESDYTKMTPHADELWLRTFIACANLGMRVGELIGDERNGFKDGLRVKHVDLASRTIRLKETKNGDDRIVPMTQEVFNLLTACISGKSKDDFVFTHKDGAQVKYFRGRWNKLLKDAGLEKKLRHDFRRSAVRNMERAGVSRSVATKISGHKTESVYRRYAIVSEADLHEAAKKIEAAKTVHAYNMHTEAQNANQEGDTKNASLDS